MGGQKLLWILLGLSLISLLVSAKSKNTYDVVEEDFEEDEDDEEDDCDPHCLKNCHELKCEAGFVRDACGCCECARSEEGMKPIIVSGPEFVKNVTGGSAALSCEVKGDPIPFISWLMTNVNNQTFELPSDDAAMMTLNQGGPEKREITAWIQIMKLRKNHEGDYTCIAFNKHGKAKATGRLKVQKKSRKNRRHHHKKE